MYKPEVEGAPLSGRSWLDCQRVNKSMEHHTDPTLFVCPATSLNQGITDVM